LLDLLAYVVTMDEDEGAPKRRRVIAADEDDDEDEPQVPPRPETQHVPDGANTSDDGEYDEDNDNEDAAVADPAQRRRAMLEQRNAERRRRRLQAEAAELRAEIGPTYPGDTAPLPEDADSADEGHAVGPDGGRGRRGYNDDDNDLDDEVDRDHDLDEDLDGDYEPEDDDDGEFDAAAAIARARAGTSARGRGRGRRGGGGRRSGPSGAAEAAGFLRGSGNYDDEEGEGEDLLENAMRDYQRIEALDTYGREGIDDRDYGQMGVEERAAAEAELAQREVRYTPHVACRTVYIAD
jgi:hypothetical protein